MKKRPSKLEDLLQAARTDAPVVSFEESAQQIRVFAEKRRKPMWIRLADAWAFPLAHLGGLRRKVLADFALPQPQGACLRGFATACLVMMLVSIFPALIHDLRLHEIRLAKQQSLNTVPKLASSESTSSLHNAYPTLLAKPIRRHFGTNTASTLAQGVPAPIADSSEGVQKHTTAFASTNNGVESALHQASTDTGEREHVRTAFGINTKTPPLLERHQEGTRSLAFAPKTAQEPHETLLPTETPEPTFWQRLSLEARLAARTDIASSSPTSSVALAPPASQQADASPTNTSTPLQNIALGVYYALSPQHSIGLEGGNEPFLVSVPVNTTNRAFTGTPGNTDTGIATVPDVNAIPRGTQNSRTEYRQSTTNRTWFGAAYQFNADVIDIFGGVQPLARITLGGGELGAVGRTLLGAKFLPKERFSIMLAGEGAAVASQLQGSWNLTPRLGVTLGLSVKF